MSVRYEEREVKQPKLIESTLVEARCDRCRKNAMFRGGPHGRSAPIWCVTSHFIQGSYDPPEQHELCHDCSEELREWIAGKS